MSQEFLAEWRIHLPYLVTTIQHKAFVFCKIQYDGGVAKLSDRATGDKAYVWTLGAQQLGAAFSTLLPSGATYGTILLEQKVGSAWIAQEAYSYVGSPGAGDLYVASQFTLTLRDDAYNKLKIVCLDTEHQPPQKYNTATGGNTNMDASIAAFCDPAGDSHSPFHWVVSRSNNFLHAVPFVSAKVTINANLEDRRNV